MPVKTVASFFVFIRYKQRLIYLFSENSLIFFFLMGYFFFKANINGQRSEFIEKFYRFDRKEKSNEKRKKFEAEQSSFGIGKIFVRYSIILVPVRISESDFYMPTDCHIVFRSCYENKIFIRRRHSCFGKKIKKNCIFLYL